MDKQSFDKSLNAIFNLNESTHMEAEIPEKPEKLNDNFRKNIYRKLRGEPSKVDTYPDNYPKLDSNMVSQRIGVQASKEDILNKLAETLNVSRDSLSVSSLPEPHGEFRVYANRERLNKDPFFYAADKPVTGKDNIGAIWPKENGFIFKHLDTHFFNTKFPNDKKDVEVIDERENPIGVDTIKNQVQNFGPEALSQIIAKLNPEMNKVDSNGQPSSEFNQFVDSIKQDGLELILKTSASAGGVKTAPTASTVKPDAASPAAEVAPKEPGQELASL